MKTLKEPESTEILHMGASLLFFLEARTSLGEYDGWELLTPQVPELPCSMDLATINLSPAVCLLQARSSDGDRS